MASAFSTADRARIPSREQRNELAHLVREAALRKLPAPGYLSHDGYLIAALAQAERISARPNADTVRGLVKDARGIPNLSDRAYVLGIVGATLPSAERLAVGRECEELIELIPSAAEQIGRMQSLAQEYHAVKETAFAREVLRKAYLRVAGLKRGEDAEERRRRLLSLAFRVDPRFAEGLATATDNDPAKDQAMRQVAVLRLRDALTSRQARGTSALSQSDLSELVRAAWLQLGSVLAGRSSPMHLTHTELVLSASIGSPMEEVYPILALTLESLVRRARGAPEQEAALRGLANSFLDVALSMSESDVRHARPSSSLSALAARAESTLVGDDQRDSALAFLSKWISDRQPRTLTIIDRYFDSHGLQVLHILREAAPEAEARVVMGKRDSEGVGLVDSDSARSAWYRTFDGEMPVTWFIVLWGEKSGDFPFHGRFIIADDDSGLSSGPSLNGLSGKIDIVQQMEPETSRGVAERLAGFLSRPRKDFQGERVNMARFSVE